MGALVKAAQEKAVKKTEAGEGLSLAELIAREWPKIEGVMPKHMSSERLFQITVSTINKEPKLAQCDVATLLSCVMKCSALGLEPSAVDGLGRAYILPYRNGKTKRMEATFILGYKGMIDLARRSGEVASISARAVYEGDKFDFKYGLEECCDHYPSAIDRTPDKLTHVYMIAHFKDKEGKPTGYHLEVMTKAEVDAIRKRSKAGDSGPWVTDYEAMAKKTVLRRAFPYLPVSIEAQDASSADGTSGGFEEMLGYAPVIAPEAEPEPQETPEPPVMEVTPESVEDAPSDGLRRAACRSCGRIVNDVTPDCGLDDLNVNIPCCDRPDYQWA